MKATNPAYASDFYAKKTIMPLENHLGFLIDIPHRAPLATPYYFGENPVMGRRELVARPDPEYFAVNNVIPMLTEKIPLVDIQDPAYKFSRARYTYYV